jgi:hypothetical protein
MSNKILTVTAFVFEYGKKRIRLEDGVKCILREEVRIKKGYSKNLF